MKPMIRDGIMWGKVDVSDAKPHQWYYKGVPCTILEWGVRRGENSPCVQKIRDHKGKVRLIWRTRDGKYPDLSYEIFEHAPGQA